MKKNYAPPRSTGIKKECSRYLNLSLCFLYVLRKSVSGKSEVSLQILSKEQKEAGGKKNLRDGIILYSLYCTVTENNIPGEKTKLSPQRAP